MAFKRAYKMFVLCLHPNHDLEHVQLMLDHLMRESHSVGKARRQARCGASCEQRNAASERLSLDRRIGALRPLRMSACAYDEAEPLCAICLTSKRNRAGRMIRQSVDML